MKPLLAYCCLLAAAVLAPLSVLAQAPAVAQKQALVAGRYIVVYRGGMPADAQQQVTRAGGRLMHAHPLFGMAVVESGEQRFVQQMQQQPRVAYVVHDRMVSAYQLKSIQAIQPPVQGLKPAGIILKPVPLPVKPFPLPITGLPIEASGSDADFYYAQTPQAWAVKQVGGYGANINGGTTHGPWDLTMGKGVRIAVLDSGVDAAHPDIAPNLVLNMTEVEQSALPSACDDGSPQDQQGHGTWVASLAAGAVGAGTGMVIGVAPQASILNIKVLQRMPGAGSGQAAQCAAGQASGLLSWVIQGIEDAVNQKADVISLSLGVMVDLYTGEGTGLQASFDAVTQAAAAQGVVIVAAAGNDGFDYSNTRYMEIPAQSRDVLAVVASTNPDCMENLSVNAACAAGPPTLAYYSNYGAPMNAVAAPGGSFPEGPDGSWSGFVRGACSASGCFNLGNVQYVQAYGTSASAPLVAGVVALLKSAHPEWDAAMLAAQIRATATPSAGMSYGVVNAAAALGMQ